ncbi:AsnC family protein [Methanosarcinales archaeon ex4484_138]|nr:MAG: AsnC family protein [Methanosarcinales archaeon ex4484_138]RLG24014.1 MAG: Lrp/AsnC family transcriptional regulator [Methanosarcinales archaeon]HHI30121.1 Lrp/AsnC family transcriptional regulator [Candidatus Methanoperedenaceae archaeon]
MDEIDEKLLRLVQDGIMITSRPFEVVAERLGIGEDEVLQRTRGMIDSGVIRRFSASIGHRAIGILANGMCVWNVPDHRVEEVGAIMAGFKEVTHCYERPRHPNWQYNMYTMIHSYTREECEEVARKISRAVGIKDYTILFSEREFKKTGVRL